MDLSSFGSLLVVGAVLGLLGDRFNAAVFHGERKVTSKGWRAVWYRTIWLHPLLAGAAIGLLGTSLPAPEFMGSGTAGRVIWFILAGGESHLIVKLVEAMFKRKN